jgi:uncharacterized protein (DUF2345 family)
MPKKTNVVPMPPPASGQHNTQQIQLDSGRQVVIRSNENEELLEVVETEGEVILEIRLTETGPVISAQGMHLELKSTETLTLESKKIKIKAEKEVEIETNGSLDIDASKEIGIHSDDEIRVVGKMIHLN